jgi:murein L,D-transpeptidase YcbB/YkuD
MTRAILLNSACVITLLGAVACGPDQTSKQLEVTLSTANAASAVGARLELVRRVYLDRDYRPLWIDDSKLEGRALDLIETLCHAEREGLRAADYDLAGLQAELARLREDKKSNPPTLAALDLRLTRAFLDYGADLLAGRLDPQAVDNGWYIKARRAAIDSTLRSALSKDDLEDMVSPLRPRQKEYKELLQMLADYRELEAKGGWGTIAEVSRLQWGDEGPWVGVLHERLKATGDLAKAGGKPIYDDEVAKAVARFQERHGIAADGSVGPKTLAALNVPVETRIRIIELNLERYRWLPSDFGKRYIQVNIPDYRLYAYDDGKERLTMRVLVGDEYSHATPVFADSMTHVVFRPQWEVPRRILVDSVIPNVRKNIHYLAQHSYEVVDIARNEVIADPSAINWSKLDMNKLPFRVRQKPGSGNELGRVKFMFPNQFSIYLHDTPADSLFQKPDKTATHGCVRVEDAVKLAGYVLDRQNGWGDKEILEAIAADPTKDMAPTSVYLKQPVPVYLVYLTAFVRDGVLHFRDDPYSKDHRAMARMGPPAPGDPTQCEQLKAAVKALAEGGRLK